MESRSSYHFPFSSYPAAKLILLLIAGILLYHIFSPPPSILYPVSILLLLLYLFLEWRNYAKLSPLLTHLSTILYLLLILDFGMIRMHLHQFQSAADIRSLAQVMPWQEIMIDGEIIEVIHNSSGATRWDLRTHESKMAGVISDQNYRARILIDSTKDLAEAGDHVSFKGTLIPIPQKRNPHDFDYAAYLKGRDISLQVRLESDLIIHHNESKWNWAWWRKESLIALHGIYDSTSYPIAGALLLGYKQELDASSRLAFARAGLSHIMAVSGLHVGFIVAPFWMCIPYFWSQKHGRWGGLILLCSILWMYAGVTGFSTSVMRASIMAAFLSYARLFQKNSNSINLTATAAILILIMDPDQLFQIGFQLSFSAVLIILYLLPVLRSYLPYPVRVSWYGKIIMVVCISLIVQLGLYPLQVYYFGELSIISPLANALFVPVLGLIVPLSFIALLIAGILPSLASFMNYPCLLFIKGMHAFVIIASEWEWAWVKADFPGFDLILSWFFFLAFLSTLRIPALRFKYLILVLCTLCLSQGYRLYQSLQPATLKITFFDVGQGDAALIQTPAGKIILMDTGVWSPGYNSGRSVLLPHLRAIGADHLDAMILSHPHADHIGGVSDLIEELPVNAIYNSGFEYDSDLYRNYMHLSDKKHIPVRAIQAGDTLDLDPSLLSLVLGPYPKTTNSDPNQHSIILKIQYGHSTFLFTGDAGIPQEKMAVHAYQYLLDADVLKVGHHGSRTSSSSGFLEQVTPTIAVISLSDHNQFKHPHKEAIHRLYQRSTDLLFTSLEGAIVLESDGTTIYRKRW